MRKSLFALESTEDIGTDVEMEVGVEEGEAADVMVDGADDMTEIGEISDAVSEGTEAADQMGQVEDLVEDAVENGEGLDPVAAEAVRISVEAICARVGANPRTVYSLYATENFQSASSRKANSRIALEGVGQFLKDLWAKIKASLKTLWEKVKTFFAKHISSLGRIKKALDSAKTKVSASSGKFKGQASIAEAPSYLSGAFAGNSAIGVPAINKFIVSHTTANATVESMILPGFAGMKVTGEVIAFDVKSGTYDLGKSDAPLVGGKYAVVKFLDSGAKNVGAEDSFNFEVERQVIEKGSKSSVALSDKAELQTVIVNTTKLIVETIKFKEKYDKYSNDQNKVMNDIDRLISKNEANDGNKGQTKKNRNALNFYYKLNAKVPSLVAEMQGANIALAKAVLGYTSLCLKNYK